MITPYEVFKSLTKKEREIVIETMAERIKNVVFMKAKNKAEQVINVAFKTHSLEEDSRLHMKYTITFVVTDLLEIVGGIRRNDPPNKK